jgi:hypothetical protein
VSVVHHAVQTLRVALVVAGCVALLAGCGSSGHGSQRKVDYSMVAGVGGSIRTANCSDWERGTELQRRSTVIRMRKFAGGPVGSSAGIQNGPVLTDERAYQLFQSWCANRFARGFKLYKLYERAAAFVGH